MLEYTFFFHNSCNSAGTVRKLLQRCGCRHPRQLMTVIMSVAITTAGCSVTCNAICVQPHASAGTYAAAQEHTWYQNRQQLFDGVHGVEQHLPVLLVRQLLLPLFNHLWHFGHPWERRTNKTCQWCLLPWQRGAEQSRTLRQRMSAYLPFHRGVADTSERVVAVQMSELLQR